jgi:hypothetical protein
MLASILRKRGLRVVGAVVEPVDESTPAGGLIDQPRDLPMDAIDILLRVAAAGDAALIGDDHETVARFAKSAKTLGNTVEELHARGITEIAVVGDQGVVTIEEDHGIHGRERTGKSGRAAAKPEVRWGRDRGG